MNQIDIFIIQMNIARYREMLGYKMDSEKRAMVERLLAEAQGHLGSEAESENQSNRGGAINADTD